MAFGQKRVVLLSSWGDAPGYDEQWPSANNVVPDKAQLQNLRVGFPSLFLRHVNSISIRCATFLVHLNQLLRTLELPVLKIDVVL